MSKQRLHHLLHFVGIVVLVGVAYTLTPDRQGFGTHVQMGLPPCPFHALFARPCPSCGLTTSLAHFVHGAWQDSWQTHPFGFLLGLGLGLAALIALYGIAHPFNTRVIWGWRWMPHLVVFVTGIYILRWLFILPITP